MFVAEELVALQQPNQPLVKKTSQAGPAISLYLPETNVGPGLVRGRGFRWHGPKFVYLALGAA